MIEVIDAECNPMGYRFSDEEAETLCFALEFFAKQIGNGNYPVPEGSELGAHELLESFEDLKAEIGKGSRAVTVASQQLLSDVVLPYILGIHNGLSSDRYGICTLLEVSPYDLFFHALGAQAILQVSDIVIAE